MGQIVAVAGNLASGKSTLAAALARHNGWRRYPRSGYDASYLDDLFRDPGRWSFEAQMSFLHHKVEAIREASHDGGAAVIDRSLSEEVLIFGRYFHARGWMSDRAHRLYMRYARPLLESYGHADVIVYCYAPPLQCEARMRRRAPRAYQAHFPPDHLLQLADLYEEWWLTAPGVRRFRVDTTVEDARQASRAKELAACIAKLLPVQPARRLT